MFMDINLIFNEDGESVDDVFEKIVDTFFFCNIIDSLKSNKNSV
jgi:hypothetical protein